jgi:hypothetical protein
MNSQLPNDQLPTTSNCQFPNPKSQWDIECGWELVVGSWEWLVVGCRDLGIDNVRLIVGITGATGTLYGVRLLERLRELDVETHLVISRWGARTLTHETLY